MSQSINVIVSRKRNVQVSANGTAGVLDTSSPVTVKAIPTVSSGGGVTRLDQLTDVSSISETNGAVPVYDSVTDKYIVQKLNMTDIVGDLDGGTF